MLIFDVYRYLHGEIQDLVSEKRCTFYLHELREVLWPGGILDENPVMDPSPEQKVVTRAQCRRCLLSFLPCKYFKVRPKASYGILT